MKYLKLIIPVLLVSMLSFILVSCEDPDPVIPNEEELITTLILELNPVGGGDMLSFTFEDLDGDGGENPIITEDTLSANTVYNGNLRLLNETETPAEDIGAEVLAEDEDHQFFFTVQGADLTVAYADADSSNNPLGLTIEFTAGNASNGQLKVTLRHEPDKFAAGVAAGDITNAGGETDIEVDFDVVIQ